MTIQTVFAPDNNAPTFDLDKPSKLTQLLTSKKFWITVTGLSVLFLLTGGSFLDLLGCLFLIFMAVMFYTTVKNNVKLFSIMRNPRQIPSYYQKNHDYFKQYLVQETNFSVDYESVGILIDTQAKRIAFTLDPSVRPQIIVCNFSDVKRWNSYSQGVETQNEHGVTLSTFSKHFVSVYIRHPEQPRYDFFTDDDVDADKWVARLDALLN